MAAGCPAPQKHAPDDDRLGEPLLPGLLRLHRLGPVQRLRPRAMAALHHHLAPHPGPPHRNDQQGPRRPAPGLLRQGRRVPAARRGPLPRHHPARRPRRTQHSPARLGHPRPAHRRHRPGRRRRPPRDSRRRRPPGADSGLGPRTRHPARHHHWGPDRRKVAAYVAKYATKAAECTGTLDRRITAADRLADLPIREHARRLISECLRLGRLPELGSLRLAAWAHMLGFRGHFSTKSRAYSTTFSALRAERVQHQREHATADGLWPDPDSDTVIVLSEWRFTGRGYPSITPHLDSPAGGNDPWT